MKLIVNADDFGYSKGVNLGILEAHREGIVTSTTMMVNMPGFDHAVRLAKDNPSLGVGIHLVLTCGSPLQADVPSLTDEAGRFRRGQAHLAEAAAEEVEREFTAQIEKFLQTGLTLTHLDSHHHVHAHAAVLPVVLRLAERYRIPIRNPWTFTPETGEESYRPVSTERFSHLFYGDDLSEATIIDIVSSFGQCSSAEIMCHPAYPDEELLAGSSYARQRARELQVLTAPSLKEHVYREGIQLVTFKDIG